MSFIYQLAFVVNDLELAEIDENLRRCELTVLEQGELLLRRDEILRAKGERWRGDGDNQYTRGGETISPPKSSADIASEIGLSERSAQQRMQIARDIAPDVKDAILNKYLVSNLAGLVPPVAILDALILIQGYHLSDNLIEYGHSLFTLAF